MVTERPASLGVLPVREERENNFSKLANCEASVFRELHPRAPRAGASTRGAGRSCPGAGVEVESLAGRLPEPVVERVLRNPTGSIGIRSEMKLPCESTTP